MAKKIVLTHKGVYIGDCRRVQKIFADKGYDITLDQAAHLWQKYGAEMLSGWMCHIASDDQIFNSVRDYWREA